MDKKTAYIAFWYIAFNTLYVLTLYFTISSIIYVVNSHGIHIALDVIIALMVGILAYMFKEWIRFNRMVLERIIKYFLKR